MVLELSFLHAGPGVSASLVVAGDLCHNIAVQEIPTCRSILRILKAMCMLGMIHNPCQNQMMALCKE